MYHGCSLIIFCVLTVTNKVLLICSFVYCMYMCPCNKFCEYVFVHHCTCTCSFIYYAISCMGQHTHDPVLILTTSVTELTLDLSQTTHLHVVFKNISFKADPTSIGTHKGGNTDILQNVLCWITQLLQDGIDTVANS